MPGLDVLRGIAILGVLIDHGFAADQTPYILHPTRTMLGFEYIARLAYRTVTLGAPEAGLAAHIAEHHYQRKHGPKATYGQKTKSGC